MNNKIYNNFGQPNQPDNNASLQKPKKTVVLHQVWGEGTTNNSNGKNKKMSSEDLSSYFMDKNRRGKKLDKKFILEKYKTTYNIE